MEQQNYLIDTNVVIDYLGNKISNNELIVLKCRDARRASQVICTKCKS